MSKYDSIATEAAILFHRHDWEWEDYGVPDKLDITTTFRQLEQHLDDLPDGTTIEIGRLMLRKNDDETLSTFVRMGDVDAD